MPASAPNARCQRTQCPQCGGTTTEVPGRVYLQCRYCHSLVFPHQEPLSDDGLICTGEQQELSCPCCNDFLRTARIAEYPALYCHRCFGVLMRNSVFGRVLNECRRGGDGQQPQNIRSVHPDELRRQLDCPGCGTEMDVHPYYGPGDTVIDSCGACALVWLDHGELTSLERAAGAAHRDSQTKRSWTGSERVRKTLF